MGLPELLTNLPLEINFPEYKFPTVLSKPLIYLVKELSS